MIQYFFEKLNFLCFVIIMFCNSLSAQNKSSGPIANSPLTASKYTVLIVEPILQRNVLPIKNAILNTIKQEIDGIYNYKILRLDSVSDFIDGKYQIRFENIINNYVDYQYILFAEQYFIQMVTDDLIGYADINYESRVTLSLFDKQGKLILRSIKDTSRLPIGTRNNPLKILERATERAISEIIEKVLILDK